MSNSNSNVQGMDRRAFVQGAGAVVAGAAIPATQALASKKPVTRYMPDAIASQAARSLAQWCLSAHHAVAA